MSAGRRTVKVEILGDAKSIASAFGSAGNAAGGFASKIGGIAKGAGMALAGIGVAAGAMAISGINAASDFEEALNKVRVVFGDSSQSVEDFAKNAAQAFGLSESSALAATGTFGNLFTSMGLGQKEAAGLSTDVLGLAADLGSFNNLGTEEVLEKIRAGLVGETEPLKSLGINLNAAAIEAKAMEMGLADATGALSPAAKAQAAYALIVEQTTNAQGDFARTKNGMANSLKVIKASFADLQVQIGQKLLPVITPLIVAFAARLPGAIDFVMKVVNRLADRLRGPVLKAFTLIRDGVLTFIQALQGNWTDDAKINGFHRVIGRIATVIREDVIPAVKTVAGWFQDTLWPILQKGIKFVGDVVTALTGGRGGGLAGALGGIGDAVSKVAPVVLTKLGQLALKIGDWLVNVAVPFIAEKLGAWADAFGAWAVDAVPPLLDKLGILLGEIGNWIAGEGLPELFDKLGQWGQALIDWIEPRIQPTLEALGGLLAAIGTWIIDTAVPEIAAKLGEWGAQFIAWVAPKIIPLLEELGILLTDVGTWIVDEGVPKLTEKLAEWGAELIAWVAPKIIPLLEELGGLLTSIGDWILLTALPEIAKKLADWGLAFLDWVGPVLADLPAELEEIAGTVLTFIRDDAAPRFGRELEGWTKIFIDWTTDVDNGLPAELQQISQSIAVFIVDNGPKFAQQLGSWSLAFVEWTTPVLMQIPEKLRLIDNTIATFIVGVSEALIPRLANWTAAFTNWVLDVIYALPDALGGILRAISGWVDDNTGNVVSQTTRIGVAAVEGVAAGIKSVPGIIADALSDMVQDGIDETKRRFDIFSPSGVTEREIGLPFSQGIAAGILAGLPIVQNAVGTVGRYLGESPHWGRAPGSDPITGGVAPMSPSGHFANPQSGGGGSSFGSSSNRNAPFLPDYIAQGNSAQGARGMVDRFGNVTPNLSAREIEDAVARGVKRGLGGAI